MAEACVVPLIEIRDEFVICEICLDYFNDGDKLPRVLPCHHSFCCQCLTSVWKNSPEGIICPNCRQIWPVQNNIEKTFPQNKVLTDLVEYIRIKNNAGEISCQVCSNKQKASTRCFDCDIHMCETCTSWHVKFPISKHHKTVSISQLAEIPQPEFFQRKDICTNHENMKVDVYCKTCCTAVCSTCAFVSHKDHEFCNLKDVYNEKKEQIKSTLCQLQTSIDKSKSYTNQLAKEKQTLDATEEQSLMKIDEASKAIIKKIQGLTQQLKDEVVRNVDKQKSDRDEQVKVVTRSINEKSEHLLRCQQALQFARQVEFTEMFECLKNQTTYLIKCGELVDLKIQKIDLQLDVFKRVDNVIKKTAVMFDKSEMIPCIEMTDAIAGQESCVLKVRLISKEITSQSEAVVQTPGQTHETDRKRLTTSFCGKLLYKPLRLGLHKTSVSVDSFYIEHDSLTFHSREKNAELMRKVMIGLDVQSNTFNEILLPKVQFDKNAVNRKYCKITDCGELLNKFSVRPDTEQTVRVKTFEGVLGNKTFHHPGCYYWQVDVVCKVLDKAELDKVAAQIGVCTQQNDDDTNLISKNRHAWCVSVDTCSNHSSLCLVINSCGKEIDDKPFADFEKNKEFIVNIGLLLDTKNRKLHIIEINANKSEYSIPDIDVSEPLIPVFGVYSPGMFDVKVKVLSGDDISLNDELLKLIFDITKKKE